MTGSPAEGEAVAGSPAGGEAGVESPADDQTSAPGSPGDDQTSAPGSPGDDRVAVESSGDLVAETLIYLARSLVIHVDDVRVEQSMGERGPIYRLRVNPEDMGRVIGKSGRLARSIRQVARAAAARAGTTAFIEIAG